MVGFAQLFHLHLGLGRGCEIELPSEWKITRRADFHIGRTQFGVGELHSRVYFTSVHTNLRAFQNRAAAVCGYQKRSRSQGFDRLAAGGSLYGLAGAGGHNTGDNVGETRTFPHYFELFALGHKYRLVERHPEDMRHKTLGSGIGRVEYYQRR